MYYYYYLLINPSENPATMEVAFIGGGDGGGDVSKSLAVIACTAMAILYVAILYAPTLILRLPPPDSFQSYLIRRFICAAISSVTSLIACSLLLPVRFLHHVLIL